MSSVYLLAIVAAALALYYKVRYAPGLKRLAQLWEAATGAAAGRRRSFPLALTLAG